MIRKPVVAGQFYPSNKFELIEEIKNMFSSSFGSGDKELKTQPRIPKTKNHFFQKQTQNSQNQKPFIKGVIVPHAGYVYSGPCASHGFKAIFDSNKSKKIDTFIILGFSHNGFESADCSAIDYKWETPLGIIDADKDLINQLINQSSIELDPKAHLYEHSIEVQLPILQYLFKDIKIVPLSVSQMCNYILAGKQIADTIKKSKKNICLITSSDFTHYGNNFNYTPFKKDILKNIKSLDLNAIKFIQSLDSVGFQKYIESTKATICGRMPIMLHIEIMKNLSCQNVELLKYYTSNEIVNKTTDEAFSNSVSYACISFS